MTSTPETCAYPCCQRPATVTVTHVERERFCRTHADEVVAAAVAADLRGCGAAVHRRIDTGRVDQGQRRLTSVAGICGRPTAGGSDLCPLHLAAAARTHARLAARKAAR